MKIIRAWGYVLAYGGFIFWLSSLSKPLPASLLSVQKYRVDLLFHSVQYGFFGLLVTRAFRHTFAGRSAKWFFGMALVLVSIYAASDEWHQLHVPLRQCSFWDWFADVVGAAFFSYLYLSKKMEKWDA
jgi:VanZ family protein